MAAVRYSSWPGRCSCRGFVAEHELATGLAAAREWQAPELVPLAHIYRLPRTFPVLPNVAQRAGMVALAIEEQEKEAATPVAAAAPAAAQPTASSKAYQPKVLSEDPSDKFARLMGLSSHSPGGHGSSTSLASLASASSAQVYWLDLATLLLSPPVAAAASVPLTQPPEGSVDTAAEALLCLSYLGGADVAVARRGALVGVSSHGQVHAWLPAAPHSRVRSLRPHAAPQCRVRPIRPHAALTY